jgi:hypothetical protein
MNMNPSPEQSDDERVLVTVMLTPSQVARLEALTAELRALDRSIDDNEVCDAVFDAGLMTYEYSLTTEPVL